jgi:5-methylcytosine-specific restriction protein A
MAYIPKNKKRLPWETTAKNDSKSWTANKEIAAFYWSPIWRKTAKAHKAANPLCVKCKEEGRIKGAEVTDHITPIEDGGARLDWNNLQSLCHSCHNSKSASERHIRKKNATY